MRSERLLRGMHKVVSHDLPNQMVAVQGLLQLLSLEETNRLSEEGREYLRRLQNAARRTAELTRFLKEMERLRTFATQPTNFSLAAFAHELQISLQQRYPAKRFEFDWNWHGPALIVDVRVLLQAMQELTGGLIQSSAAHCRVSASSKPHDGTLELAFCLEQAQTTGSADEEGGPIDQRLEIILAREWLALINAGVDLELPAGAEVRWSIRIPNQ